LRVRPLPHIDPTSAFHTYVVVEVGENDVLTTKFAKRGFYKVEGLQASAGFLFASPQDRQKLVTFKAALERNAPNPLSVHDIKRFIATGLLRRDGVAVRLAPKGEGALA